MSGPMRIPSPYSYYVEKDHFPARMTSTTEFIDDDCLLMIEGVAYREQ